MDLLRAGPLEIKTTLPSPAIDQPLVFDLPFSSSFDLYPSHPVRDKLPPDLCLSLSVPLSRLLSLSPGLSPCYRHRPATDPSPSLRASSTFVLLPILARASSILSDVAPSLLISLLAILSLSICLLISSALSVSSSTGLSPSRPLSPPSLLTSDDLP
ncbi:hypothetical protein ACLOJK_041949 [Asimina triloba]